MNLVELQVAQSISNEQDESAPLEDSMDDEPIIQSPQSLQESDIPPREGLYSTPLSWERPKLDCRVGNLLQFEPLSPEEESRLLAIAMPAQSPPMTPPLSPSHAPERTHSSRKRESRKRRSSKKSSQRSASASSTAPHAARPFSSHTTAHNIVERRYRTNLNLKIAALRDSVPSLRVLDQNNPCNEDSKDDLQGLSAAHKHNRVLLHFHCVSCTVPSSLISSWSVNFCIETNQTSLVNHSLQSSRIHHRPRETDQISQARKRSPELRNDAFEIFIPVKSGPGLLVHTHTSDEFETRLQLVWISCGCVLLAF